MIPDAVAEKVNLPAIAMIIAGVINILFWLAWTGYALFAIVVGGGLNAVMTVPALLDGADMATIISRLFGVLWAPLIQSCNCCTDVFLVIGAIVTVMGGLRLRAATGKGVVQLGLVALVLGPVLSIVLGAMAAVASFNCCGLVFGQLPTVILFVLNLIVAILVAVTLSNEEVGAAFEANAG